MGRTVWRPLEFQAGAGAHRTARCQESAKRLLTSYNSPDSRELFVE